MKNRRGSVDSGGVESPGPVTGSRRGSLFGPQLPQLQIVQPNGQIPKLNLNDLESPNGKNQDNNDSMDSARNSNNTPNNIVSPDNKKESNLGLAGFVMVASQLDRILVGKSLFIFSPSNRFRRLIAKITVHSYFEWFIITAILFSSITLAIDNPFDDPNSQFQQALDVIDIVMTVIFTLEIVFKVITYGAVFNGSTSFIFSFWNLLDLTVVAISWVILIVGSSGSGGTAALQKVKVLRTLRVLRPLRLISRNEGFKVALTSIISAVPVLFNLLLVCMLFFLLFGIIGVNYLKGTFYYCDMTNIPFSHHSSISTKIDCMNYGGDWVNSDYNFDNVLNALQLLFVVSTTEGWIEIM